MTKGIKTGLDRTVLGAIVEHKQREVEERKHRAPSAAVPAPTGRFRAALSKAGLGLIAEIKERSPSSPRPLRPDFSVDRLLAAYEPSASAVSVLADERYFGGSLDRVAYVAEKTSHPVLLKDFVISQQQLLEARAAGASAVLLMASILEPSFLSELLHNAQALGLDALVEVHDEEELEEALRSGATIVGVNNRDLRTLEIDLENFLRLAPKVPSECLRVCESGLRTREDIETIRSSADAVLIGSALVTAPDPKEMLEHLGWA